MWPRLVAYAEGKGVNIAIENCPMIFSWDEWPGGTNLASTPAVWDEMFTIVPSPGFGLNLDPSHLVWLGIDHERVVRDYASRLLHVHAKDMEVDRDGLYRNGVVSLGMGWQIPRLPGLGEVRWDRFLSQLYRVGYDGVVSVEHEDRAFEKTEDLVKRGFLIARDALRPYSTDAVALGRAVRRTAARTLDRHDDPRLTRARPVAVRNAPSRLPASFPAPGGRRIESIPRHRRQG